MWLVCQIGAREHYGIARGLRRAGQLTALVTDCWVAPGSMVGRLPGTQRLADRFHPDLAHAAVHAPNLRMLGFELLARMRKHRGWERMLARNALFQSEALKVLSSLCPLSPVPCPLSPDLTLFSYSYAALELFRYAKHRGWTTVLGQIDPGPGEDAIVRRLREQFPEWAGDTEASPPAAYWDAWREECSLADRIVVNSAWSRSLLIDAGIAADKITVVALALAVEAEDSEQRTEDRSQNAGRALASLEKTGAAPTCMAAGNSDPSDSSLPTSGLRPPASDLHPPVSGLRPPVSGLPPLRVLWLGQVNVRKGIQDLAAAARLLDGTAVRIDVVGPHGPLPAGLPNNMTFHGAVPRSEAGAWYDQADVFVLPTHSDGFALTQLEAMARSLPVIATACCGEVVEDGVNGWIIPTGDPQALAARIRQIAIDPACLKPMRLAACQTAANFGLDRLVTALVAC